MSETKKLVLASSSPRRQAFLRELGLVFTTMPADIDETPLPNEMPVALAARLASSKARAIAARISRAEYTVIVASDTVVALGQTLLGKPEDDADASRILSLLRGCAHEVHSAVSVLDVGSSKTETAVSTTTVWMRNYTDAEIAAYVGSGDPMDKAGAYAIQHPTFDPAETIVGCLSGVIGLPLGLLRDLLREVGVVIPTDVVAVCEAQTHFACCQRQR